MFGDLTRIGSNFHAQESYFTLRKINGNIGTIRSRLSTGKRINSAEDDTSGYALSKQLESRVRGLTQALENVGTAKNVLGIAEGGYQSQMNILQTVKEKLTQAADGSFSTDQRKAIGDQVSQLLLEFDDIRDDTKFNDYTLMQDGIGDRTIAFHVGEGNADQLSITLDNSNRTDVGEATAAVNLDSIVGGTAAEWANLDATEASAGITTLGSAITALSQSIQKIGDYNVRLSSKEESLSNAISNTESTRSRIEDADFAKEQMDLMKLSILQQTTVASFAQSNSSSQMVLALFQ